MCDTCFYCGGSTADTGRYGRASFSTFTGLWYHTNCQVKAAAPYHRYKSQLLSSMQSAHNRALDKIDGYFKVSAELKLAEDCDAKVVGKVAAASDRAITAAHQFPSGSAAQVAAMRECMIFGTRRARGSNAKAAEAARVEAERVAAAEAARAEAERIPAADIARRQVAAARHLRDSIAAADRSLPAREVAIVAEYYLRKKYARLDVAAARSHVKHGGYLDAPTIRKALAIATKSEATVTVAAIAPKRREASARITKAAPVKIDASSANAFAAYVGSVAQRVTVLMIKLAISYGRDRIEASIEKLAARVDKYNRN